MPDVSLAALALRLGISMGVVIALMVLAAKLLKRAQAAAAGSAARDRGRRRTVRIPIDVTATAPLTRAASVAVVRAAGRELVLGVTEHTVTLLHSADPRDEDDDDHIDLDHEDQATPVEAARIAASIPDRTSAGAGESAWTDALETLRARTARRPVVR